MHINFMNEKVLSFLNQGLSDKSRTKIIEPDESRTNLQIPDYLSDRFQFTGRIVGQIYELRMIYRTNLHVPDGLSDRFTING